nr:rhodanese-like domain-containing protein [Halalkalibacterium halodurans]
MSTSDLKKHLMRQDIQYIGARTSGEFSRHKVNTLQNIRFDEHFQKGNQLSKKKEVVVIFQWNAKHIPGSVNIPLGLLEFSLHELDKTKEYIIVCRSGARSGRTTEFLSSHGFHAINMVGGMMNWEGNVQ